MSSVGSRNPFTAESLPEAIASLFRLNQYNVDLDVSIHGAQVDIVAKPKADPFAQTLYIEATIEYVDNEKYSKDSTKFLLLRKEDPRARLLCVSSSGFSTPVKERAKASDVEALTYDELFSLFEKFGPYVQSIEGDSDLIALESSYEEPNFRDQMGQDKVINWLDLWKGYKSDSTRWLLVLGEYGTGKTALTKVMQRRWLRAYSENPSQPIPLRIELRAFTRQFDENGLLHYFLDTNNLSHISIDFLRHLIRTGRVVLLLDGYDEMAQFMNVRERRTCLTALARLASDGAKGILTSRPNYFTETEELNVFETLYRTIEQGRYYLSESDEKLVTEERAVDELVERYVLNRYERIIQDLTADQTKSLVRRILKNDSKGERAVLGILDKVFREEGQGHKQSLSGKPVIITYLLELVGDLKSETTEVSVEQITEWDVYKLIIDRLMLRDLTRTPMNPDDRRSSLQSLAIALSSRDTGVATEDTFVGVINSVFSSELKRLPVEERRARRTELFEDLRSSATLTRAGGSQDGWVFSHNSLREFLVAERAIFTLRKKDPIELNVPVTEPMRGFVASMGENAKEESWSSLSQLWPQRANRPGLGSYLSLLWEHIRRLGTVGLTLLSNLDAMQPESKDSIYLNLGYINARDLEFDWVTVNRIVIHAKESNLQECVISDLDLSDSNFNSATLDGVNFCSSSLSKVDFREAFIFECDFSHCSLDGADFSGCDTDISIYVANDVGDRIALIGQDALGYLAFHGAETPKVSDFERMQHHPLFPIAQKIVEKVSNQRNSQKRGLTQRGEAQRDPKFARAFVEHLERLGWLEVDKNELVSVPSEGRAVVQAWLQARELPREVSEWLDGWK